MDGSRPTEHSMNLAKQFNPTDTIPAETRARRESLRRAPIALFAAMLLAFASVGCSSQNGNDSLAGLPSASFEADVTSGLPGLTVQFTNSSTGDIDSYLWDFGDGITSTDPNPVGVVYTTAGTFDVSLTVSGARGSSTQTSDGFIEIADIPTAGFSCLSTQGFAPLTTTCVSSAVGATTTQWTFTNGTETVISSDESPVVTLTTAGVFDVTQTVTNVVGTDTVMGLIEVRPLTLSVTPVNGVGPGNATLSADTDGLTGLITWTVDGVFAGNVESLVYDFDAPGTYSIQFEFGSFSPPVSAVETFDYVVPYGVPAAGFSADVSEAAGPLLVTFADQSVGQIVKWNWDFGDGVTCVYPAPDGVPPDSPGVCDGESPTHTYGVIGRYDVELMVEGLAEDTNDPNLMDVTLQANAVTVTILDPSFEGQTATEEIAQGWRVLRADASPEAEHIALSSGRALRAGDAGMPTDGEKWAALDGLGTDGTDPVLTVENGIQADFILPTTATVLEFDYALLYSEPPAGLVLDAMTATVTDGVTTVEITSAAANVENGAYSGGSTRYEEIDGGTTRVTIVRTASLDVAAFFPSATANTVFTLTIRLTNAENSLRPPRAYVDAIRFADPATAFTSSFSAPVTVVAGDTVDFLDDTCLDPIGLGCEVPTSWRWDFDTRDSLVPPTSTGSALQDPSYEFTEAGVYDVTLLARNADQESLAMMTVEVIDAPVSLPVIVSFTQDIVSGFWDVQASGVNSTSDITDPIVDWSWDFAGWGVATGEVPSAVEIRQAGTWTIRLTVTTALGLVAEGTVDVTLE